MRARGPPFTGRLGSSLESHALFWLTGCLHLEIEDGTRCRMQTPPESVEMRLQTRKTMVLAPTTARLRRVKGYMLAEVMVAVGVVSLFMVVCFTSIMQNRSVSFKSREEAVVMDFLIHYTESLKGLPYQNVQTGKAVGTLFDGEDGAPNIRIPADGVAVSLNTSDYLAFHPDLIWIKNLDPKLKVKLTQESADVKHVTVSVEWDSPLGRGGRLQDQLDLVRVKDL